MSDWTEAEKHVERAHEHYEAGRWGDAETELREALALNPYRAEWHFNLGLTLEAAGRYRDAVRAFRDAHELDPADYQTLIVLAVNSIRAEDANAACAWLELAESLDPDRADAFVYRIEAMGRLGRFDDAELAFYQALQLEGDHALAFSNMGECLLDRGENDRAVFCFREAASIDPGLPRVHARLAYAYAQTGRHERARQLYMRELRDNPGDIETLLDLGCLLMDMNRLAEAGEKFRRVLEIETDNPDAHFFLGEIAERQHRFDRATELYALVLGIEDDYPGARRRVARLELRRGEVSEARRLLRRDLRQLRERPRDFTDEDLDELGQLLLDVRLPRDAQRVFRALTERRPEQASAWHSLALAQFNAGDRSGGIISTRRALRHDGRHVPALHNLALAMIQERQWGRARSIVRRALEVDPEDVMLRRLALTLKLHRAVTMARWVLRPLKRRA